MTNRIKNYRDHSFKAQQGRCYYCDCQMWMDDDLGFCQRYSLTKAQAVSFRCTAEHIVAKCEGGKDSATNIAAACAWCNKLRHARKQAMQPTQFRNHVARRIRRGGWHGLNVVARGLLATATPQTMGCSKSGDGLTTISL